MATPLDTYLLDTNIIIHLVRGSALGQAASELIGPDTGLSRCAISVVTVGEIYSFALQQTWGEKKVSHLMDLVAQVVQIDINYPETLTTYAELDALSRSGGVRMGKNDLWIAATARVTARLTGVTLLTTDRDFDHLHPDYLKRVRFDPQTGKALP